MLDTSIEILKTIENNGYKAYIVGGFVRDYILGIKSIDVDICTNATPKELIKIFDAAIPNMEYGSVTLTYKKINFEITTFRRERKYINHRKPSEIEYIDDLKEDLLRRDITINTLCMNSNKEIIDLLDGMKDIKNKVIRVVGIEEERLDEDTLRILRIIRFATKLNFKIDFKTSNAIRKKGHLLKEISYTRKKEELEKIFSSKNVKYGIHLIKKYNLDKYLELNNIKKLKIVEDIHGIWAQLDVLDKYNFNKQEYDTIKTIEDLLKEKGNIIDEYTIYKYGGYITTIVAKIMGLKTNKISEIYENLEIYNKSDLDITGDKISKVLDKDAGNWISEVIKDVEKQIVYKKLENKEDKILDYIIRKYK